MKNLLWVFMLAGVLLSTDVKAFDDDDDSTTPCLMTTAGVCSALVMAAEVAAPVLAYYSSTSENLALAAAIDVTVTALNIPICGYAANACFVRDTKSAISMIGNGCLRTLESGFLIGGTVMSWLYWNSTREGHTLRPDYRVDTEILTGLAAGLGGLAALGTFITSVAKKNPCKSKC